MRFGYDRALMRCGLLGYNDLVAVASTR